MNIRLKRSLERLCRWRMVFASWQLGTRSSEDAECQAVRDHREVTMILRAEMNALVGLLVDKRIFSGAEWEQQLIDEAENLSAVYEERFPGFKASDVGMEIDAQKAAVTSKNWPA